MMVRIPLEFRSTVEVPIPSKEEEAYILLDKHRGYVQAIAIFVDGEFNTFAETFYGHAYNMDNVICWAEIPNASLVQELFEDIM